LWQLQCSSRWLAFVLGYFASLAHYWLFPSASTFFSAVPLMWSWGIVSKIAGPAFADRQQYISIAAACAMHGVVFLMLCMAAAAMRRLISRTISDYQVIVACLLIYSVVLAYV
jgi:hypothetical protein